MRDIPDPGFAGDGGAADPDLARALAAYDADPERLHRPTLAVLQHARLLVPVMAVAGGPVKDRVDHGGVDQDGTAHDGTGQDGVDQDGTAHEKRSEMATVLIRGQDGRLALMAFTSTDSMAAWNPEARPVAVPATRAAEAAVHDDAAALVVDVAGPALFVVEGEDLRSLAEGYTLVQLDGRFAWAKPQG